MAENKSGSGIFHEKRTTSGSFEESSGEEDNQAATGSSSSDEGEYQVDSDPEVSRMEKMFNKLSDGESDDDNPVETMPSAILDKDYIYMPRAYENFEDREEWKSSGKWLLYTLGDFQKLDYVWLNLRPLLADGTLICIKSSTGTSRSKSFGGVVMCYTPDCDDKKAVKKAADAIRSVANDEEILYYKTNQASDSGLYKSHGDNFITKYMHTVAGSLYERDEYNRWKKVFFDSDAD